jgi:SAM-dependent methyltransferase
MPEFATRDPRSPAFWDERFARGFMPWDRGGVPQDLADFAERSAKPLVTLIPGCGTAYELAYLARRGWEATAIDFSPEAVASARAALAALPTDDASAAQRAGIAPRPLSERVQEADFFIYQPEQALELIYERAFLCALPRAMWPQVVMRWAALLQQGASLAGFFFYDDSPKGPPFGTSQRELEALLTPHFERIEDKPVSDSVPVFQGKERWQHWRRR